MADYNPDMARERMIADAHNGVVRKVNMDEGEKKKTTQRTFSDKVASFSKKMQITRENSGKGTDHKTWVTLTDEGKKSLITKTENEYKKKFRDIFGTEKGNELAQAVINAEWKRQHHKVRRENSDILYGGAYGVKFEKGDFYEEDFDEDDDWDTFEYVCNIHNRVKEFGQSENIIICSETEKAIKSKFGKKLADKFKDVMGKVYTTAENCDLCRWYAIYALQSEIAGRIYKGIEKNKEKWLTDFLDTISKDCDVAKVEKKNQEQVWNEWGKQYK